MAESVKELREEMRCYLSFTDHEVFEGMIPPEETIPDPVKESHLASEMDMIVDVPKESATRKTLQGLDQERKCPKFPDGRRSYIHPSQWQLLESLLTLPGAWSRLICLRPPTINLWRKHPPKPTFLHRDRRLLINGSLFLFLWMWPPVLRSQSSKEVPKTPPIPVVMGMMAAPGMVTMSTSWVVWDEATGATYLDAVTTSIGRVALIVPEDKIITLGPKIEDVMDLF